jgi:hypothetical protein
MTGICVAISKTLMGNDFEDFRVHGFRDFTNFVKFAGDSNGLGRSETMLVYVECSDLGVEG